MFVAAQNVRLNINVYKYIYILYIYLLYTKTHKLSDASIQRRKVSFRVTCYLSSVPLLLLLLLLSHLRKKKRKETSNKANKHPFQIAYKAFVLHLLFLSLSFFVSLSLHFIKISNKALFLFSQSSL